MSRTLDLTDQQRRTASQRRGARATNRRPDSYSSARRVRQRSSYGTHAGRDLDADARADLERQERIEAEARARHAALVKRAIRQTFVRGQSDVAGNCKKVPLRNHFLGPDPDAALRVWAARRNLDPRDELQIQRYMLGPRGPERQRRPDPADVERHRQLVQRALRAMFR